MTAAAAAMVLLAALPAGERLPARVRQVVLHVLGGPSYGSPEMRWVFLTPPQTFARWKPTFGAHWIVWTDGTVWPRQAPAGAPPSWTPPAGSAAGAGNRRRLAREAAPVYGHVRLANSRTLGIELAHSGRSADPFPEAQVRTLAWLLRALFEMSGGRLGPADVVGHKDLDRRPAYVKASCERPGCAVFVDEGGRAYRRRVDPPESLFAVLARHGLTVPRPAGDDAELRRAEMLAGGVRPGVDGGRD